MSEIISEAKFNSLCDELRRQSYSNKWTAYYIQQTDSIIAQIIEYIICSDNKDEVFFQFFAEKGMLPILLKILSTCNDSKIQIQILQAMNILCHSVTTIESLYLLL
jgi:uncharacterized integral membrane protein